MNQQDEIWKDIPGYEGIYKVSSFGRVHANASVTNQYHIKGDIYEIKYRYNNRKCNKNGGLGGYCVLALYKNGKRTDVQLHRLIAQLFIPNPNNLPQVNHIDGDKTNNRVDNLEWCDNSYNQLEAYRLGLRKKKYGKNHMNSKPITQCDKYGNAIREWENISRAQEYYGNGTKGNISMCLRNKSKTAYGYIWKYKEVI